jgi:hypothetical protein
MVGLAIKEKDWRMSIQFFFYKQILSIQMIDQRGKGRDDDGGGE